MRAVPRDVRPVKSDRCPRCGTQVSSGDVICVACGTNLLTGKRVTLGPSSATGTGSAPPAPVERNWRRWLAVGGIIAASLIVVVAIVLALYYLVFQDFVGQGRRQYAEGQYAEAAESLQKAVSRNQKPALAHYYLGLVYTAQGKTQAATDEFSQSVEIDPSNVTARLLLAISYALLAPPRYANEIEQLEAVLERQPGNTDASLLLGLAYSVTGRIDEAVSKLEGAVANQPSSDAAHYLLAVTYARQGRYEAALREADRALSINPSLGDAHFLQGLSLNAEGNLTGTLQAMKVALENNTQFRRGTRYFLGLTLLSTKRYDDAIREFEYANRLSPDDHATEYLLGIACRMAGRLDEALRHLNRVIEIDRGFTSKAHVQTAIVYIARDDLQQARTALERALEIDSNNAEAASRLALLYDRMGRDLDAIRYFKIAINKEPDNPSHRLALGSFYAKRNQTAEAIRELKTYLRRAPEEEDVSEVRRVLDLLQGSMT